MTEQSIVDRFAALTPDAVGRLGATLDLASSQLRGEPIAVVGLACRLPGGVRGTGDFADLLARQDVPIKPADPRRWFGDASGVMGAFLDDVWGFDAGYFKLAPREVASLDPQQRLLLEVIVEAIEDSGRTTDDLRGSATGVFVGLYHHDFEQVYADRAVDAYAATGNAHSVAAGRIAYTFDLHGPAISYDTACSTSLVALHEACRSLEARDCDAALVGGVNILLSRATHDSLDAWGMLSPRARCSAFDAAADGFVRGEGVGAVCLKRLVDALADGDEVLAVVRGSAVNQDGRSQGLTAPNGPAQVAVMTQALANAGLGGDAVGFVETHGTGTALGDPIEFEALDQVYGAGDRPCWLGSVKSNIGHLEAAAGIVGFIKAVLVLAQDTIPANPGFVRLNPRITPGRTRLQIAGAPAAWPAGPRRAAVSSFGFGGTNAHVVVEQGAAGARWPRPRPRQWSHVSVAPERLTALATVPGDWFLVPALRLVDEPVPGGATVATATPAAEPLAGATPASAAPSPEGPFLVLSEGGARAAVVAAGLADQGLVAVAGRLESPPSLDGHAVVVVLHEPADPAPNPTKPRRDEPDLHHASATPEPDEPALAHALAALHHEGADLAAVARAVRDSASSRLLVASVGGQSPDGPVDPAEASLWGWARGLALELGDRFAGAVDVAGLAEAAAAIRRQTSAADDERLSHYRDGRRWAPRLVPAEPAAWGPPTAHLDPDRSYLVVGANGPVGLALAEHLAARGARHLTLTARSQPQPALQALADRLAADGVDVRWERARADSPAEMARLIDRFGADRPPLTGVFLTAFAGGPVALDELDETHVADMFGPKADAAEILDRLTWDLPLTAFVLFSSTTGLLGSRHLAHYSAASAYLDGLARRRRASGRAAVSIDWGIWARRLDETGAVEQRYVHESGLRPMADSVAILALDRLLGPAAPAQALVADADWGLLRDAYRTRTAFTLLDEVAGAEPAADSAALAEQLRALAPADRPAAVVGGVRRLVAEALHVTDPSSLDTGVGLFDLGLDSLMGLQVQRSLNREYGLALAPTVVFSHPTIAALADHVLAELNLAPETDSTVRPAPGPGRLPGADEPIAIVGMACRFPGGSDPEEFWQTLASGADAITGVPAERWDPAHFAGADATVPGTIGSGLGGFLTDWSPAEFDAAFFGLSGREAAAMDPQQRLILELSVEALADAGLGPRDLEGSRTAVVVGVTTHDYLLEEARALTPDQVDAYTTTGNAANFAAGRVSYHLGLQGPALAVDTACSSSLTALHVALGQLRAGDCDAALVGGVNLMLAPETSISFTRWGMLSPRGRCCSYDESADGFARGEGAGVVLLKPLSAARRDRDRIVAVLRGSACGQDGVSAGQTVPNGAAQAAVVRAALERSGLVPDDIDLVEGHGAATPVGDPIELEALAEVFGQRATPLVVGSVKAVVGHLEAAAGVAGLIKAALAVSHRQIPPQPNFRQLTSRVSPEAARVVVPTALTTWPRDDRPARVGLSSFGASGTNVHVVVEEAPPATGADRAVWLYSGQGSQWQGMGTALLESSPAFAQAIAELAPLFAAETGRELVPLLTGQAPLEGIDVIQPALFSMQVALSRAWEALGARPAAVIGHSMGEVAAAVVAGALSPADGMKVIARRSRLLTRIAGQGAMAAIEADAAGASELVAGRADVDVAVIASPQQTVISGAPDAIAEIVADFESRGLFAKEILVDVASHSPQVDPLLDPLRQVLADLDPRQPTVPFLSTVDDRPRAHDADYWADNLRRPVRFKDAVGLALAAGERVFVEMAPHPLLTASVLDVAQDTDVMVVPSLRRGDPSVRPVLWQRRPRPAWRRQRYWFEPAEGPGVESGESVAGQHAVGPDGDHLFTCRRILAQAPWLADHVVDGVSVMPLAGWVGLIAEAVGQLDGPDAVVTITDLELSNLLRLDADTDVTIVASPAGERAWRFRLGSPTGGWLLCASADVVAGDDAGEPAAETVERIAPEPAPGDTGQLAHEPAPGTVEHPSHESAPGDTGLLAPTGPALAPAELYRRLESVGQQQTGIFRSVESLVTGGDGLARAELRLTGTTAWRRWRVFPALLDGALQSLSAAGWEEAGDRVVLPRRVARVRLSGRFADRAEAEARLAASPAGQPADPTPATTLADPPLAPTKDNRAETRPNPALAGTGPDRSPAGGWPTSAPFETPAGEPPAQRPPAVAPAQQGGAAPMAPRWVGSCRLRAAGASLEVDGIDLAVLQPTSAPRPVPFFDTRWLAVPRPTGSQAPQPGSVLVVTRGAEAGSSDAAALAAALGASVTTDVDRLGQAVGPGVVAVAALCRPPTETAGDEDAVLGAIDFLGAVATGLVGLGLRDTPRLYCLLPRPNRQGLDGSAESPVADVVESPTAAALIGLGRVLAYEHPDLRATTIVFDDPVAAAAEIRGDSDDTCVVVGAGERWAPRLAAARPGTRSLDGPVAPDTWVSAELVDAAVVLAERPQRADWSSSPSRERGVGRAETAQALRRSPSGAGVNPTLPAGGEVWIRVEAVGINFSDVLKARGAYPLQEGEPLALGGEVAGRVVAAGPASRWQVGDRVFGFAEGALGTIAPSHTDLLARLPDDLTPEEAATLPVAYATALHALTHLARLRAGQTVLIHTAAGGVGSAALALAHHVGAHVLATAGSPAKRDHVRAQGVAGVWNSRDLAFADAIASTRGGVDVVLNTLSGPAFSRGLALVNPGGHFLELGKQATFGHASVDLGPLRRGASLSTIDLAFLLRHDRRLAAELLDEVVDGLEQGWVRPLPRRVYPLADLDRVWSDFAAPDHIGKVVVVPTAAAGAHPAAPTAGSPSAAGSPGALTAQPPLGRLVRPAGSYIVTGALSGLGWATAAWLAAQEPGGLVLNGRHGPAPDKAQAIEDWRSRGIAVEVVVGDVADPAVASALVGAATAGGLTPRGLIHSAGVVEDQTVMRLGPALARRVVRPKVAGAAALLDAVADRPLDFAVLYSSAAALLGSPGQGAYAAANAAMEAVGRRHRRRGQPVVSVHWGPWGETGRATGFAALGYGVLTSAEGLAALERLIRSDAAATGVFDVDARQWFQSYPVVSGLPYFALVGDEAPRPDGWALSEAASHEERHAQVSSAIVDQLVGVLRVDPARLDPDAPFKELGLDSLMALELRNRLERRLAVKLPVTVIWSSPTIRRLADEILGLLAPVPPIDPIDPIDPVDPAPPVNPATRTADPAPPGSETTWAAGPADDNDDLVLAALAEALTVGEEA